MVIHFLFLILMAPTRIQLSRKGRKKKIRRCRVSCLFGKPQKRVLVYKVAIMSPRKPNSAKRKHAKVRILGENFTGKRGFAHIPGQGDHGLHDFSVCLMEGKGPPDLPGVNYSLIRGSLDFLLSVKLRVRRRSKFGLKRRDVVRDDDLTYPDWWGNPAHEKHPKKMVNAY